MKSHYLGLLMAGLFALAVGCSDPVPAGKTTPAVAKDEHDDDHAHPSAGPHGGALIELGEEEYHAELVHDEKADEIVIYILDGGATKAVPIEATELVINLKHHGKPEQHKLVAVPQESDPEGKCSRFVAKDNPELNEDLEHDDADPRLPVTIAGKPYTGEIKLEHGDDHEHDKKGHEHKDAKKK